MSQNIVAEFECPVCLDYMAPPIHQCTMGHTFCLTCFDKFTRCPTCRGPKGVSRAFALERIYSTVFFPCKYRGEGCNIQTLGSDLVSHQESCEFAKNACLFANALHCQWTGQKSDVLKHCKSDHPANVQHGNSIILKCPMFDLLGLQEAFYFTIIQAYGEQFEFCWSLCSSGQMKWAVYFMGDPKERKRYKYELSIGKPNGEYEPIVMSSSCEQLVPELELFDPKNCLMTHYETTRKRCNKNGDLHYEILIIDKAFDSLKSK